MTTTSPLPDLPDLPDGHPATWIEYLRDVVFRTQGKTYWSYLSPAWERLTGFTVAESLGRDILEFVFPDDRPENMAVKERLESGQQMASRHIKRLLRKDGSFVWIEVDLRVLRDASGELRGSIGTIRDISERIALETALAREQALASVTLGALTDGVLIIDPVGHLEYINPAATTLLGVASQNLLGQPALSRLVFDGLDFSRLWADARRTGQTQSLGSRGCLLVHDGRRIEVDGVLQPLPGEDAGLVLVLRDVREQRALQARLSFQATHDALTQLLNRAALTDALARIQARTVRQGGVYSVLLVDIDHFKLVNDHYGHSVGDEAIRWVSRTLAQNLRPEDEIGRWGGEEFLIVLPDADEVEAKAVAERMLSSVRALPSLVPGDAVSLTVSVGVATASSTSASPAVLTMVQQADAALYEAKRAGRDRVWVYSSTQPGVVTLATRVQAAIQAGGVRPLFQPIHDRESGALCAYEVFAQIIAPDGSVMMADQFMPALQRVHRAHRVDAAVIPLALRDCPSSPGQSLHCVVHLSADMLRRPSVMAALLTQLLADGVVLSNLVIKMGERAELPELSALRPVLDPWFQAGATLLINQNSTGQAALSYWIDWPVSFVQLDGVLLRQALTSPRAYTVLQALNALAQTLGYRTIAEQVDRPELLELVREIGVDWVQGYLFGTPRPA
ncbi:diguanylate cyclase [Halothiobacillus sp. DCM-1]|uniref:diguanylate cyclase n=1 Tax=Halothiobacillus sp. DCM-1 TaxID=3112558 RepID=UPI0032458E52